MNEEIVRVDSNNLHNFVSVVIPAHNAEATIKRCIESVPERVEVIVVLDKCSDSTASVAIQSRPSVKLISSSHGDPGLARQVGVSLCETRFVAFLDADDFFYPDKLTRQIGVMVERRLDWTCTSYSAEREDGTQVYVLIPRETIDYEKLLIECDIGNSTVVVSKAILPLVFPPRPKEDFKLWLGLTRAGHVCVGLRFIGTRYSLHPNQDTSNRLRALSQRTTVLRAEGLNYITIITITSVFIFRKLLLILRRGGSV